MLATIRSIVPLEAGAEHLRHHAAQRGDDDLAQRREPFVGAFERRQVHDEDAPVQHHVPHVDVRLLDLENVTERDAEQFEGAGKIELGEAVLLRGLLGLLLVPVEGQIIGGQFAEIGFERVDDVLGHIRDRNVRRLAGRGIPDLECALHRHFPDAAELEGETDRLDVERHALMVAHPDEDGRQRADEGDGAIAKNLVAVPRRQFPELARQHFADRVGVADGEGVEGVRVLDAGRHHEVEAENVVLAAEAAGERQNLAVELVVRLAVHQHEAGGVGQRVRQE